MSIKWTVWYDGGRRFDSSDTRWEDLPDDGVLYVAVKRTQGYMGLCGSDYYFKSGEIVGMNNDPPEDTLARYPGAVLKRGRWTTEDEMRDVETLAQIEMGYKKG